MPASLRYVLASRRRRLLLDAGGAEGLDITFSAANLGDNFASRDAANYDWEWDATNVGIRAIAKTGQSGDTFDHVHDCDVALPSATEFDILIEYVSVVSSASDLVGISFNRRLGEITPWHTSEGICAITDQFNRIEPDYGLFEQAGRTTNFVNIVNMTALVVTSGTEYFLRVRRDGASVTMEYGETADGLVDATQTGDLTAGEQAELIGTGWGVFDRRNGTRTPTYVVKRTAMGALNSLW